MLNNLEYSKLASYYLSQKKKLKLVDQFTFHISLPSLKFTIFIHLFISVMFVCVINVS